MRRFTPDSRDEAYPDPRPPNSAAPPVDGGYAVDGDLHQMTDDGCPLSPDPTRWGDPEWRDDAAGGRDTLGELDTFGPPPADAPTVRADSHWQRLQDRVELRGRWRAACERMAHGPNRARSRGPGTGE